MDWRVGSAPVTCTSRSGLGGLIPDVTIPCPPRFQESCHPCDQYTRRLEDMTNASLQRSRQSEREMRMEYSTGKVAQIPQELGIHICNLYNGRPAQPV